MFGFKKKHEQIHARFVQVGEAAPFAETVIAVQDLPDTFLIDTRLQIGGVPWLVESAVPPTKREFSLTGKLTVMLKKEGEALQVDPQNILYSLPTINDVLPALVEADSLEDVHVAHEDDWRQVEFVETECDEQVALEMQAVRSIMEQHAVGIGFRKIHVRSQVAHPLSSRRLTVSDLELRFGVEHRYHGVAFSSQAAVIANGFAFRTPQGWVIWGQQRDDGALEAACFTQADGPSPMASMQVASFLAENGLRLVDWAGVARIPS